MHKLPIFAAFIGSVAVPAIAQELTFADIGLRSQSFSSDTFTGSSIELGGKAEFAVQNFVLGFGLDYGSQFGDFEASGSQVLLMGAYRPVLGMLVGGEYTAAKSTRSGIVSDRSTSELFAQYETDTYGAALVFSEQTFEGTKGSVSTQLYGRTAVTSEVTLLAELSRFEGFDYTSYQLGTRYDTDAIEAVAVYQGNSSTDEARIKLSGRYDFAAPYEVSATYRTRTGDDFDSAFLSLAAAYDVTPELELSIGYATDIGSDASEFDTYQIGAEYMFSDKVTLNIRAGREESSGSQTAIYALTLDYELGETARLARRIFEDFSLRDN